MVLGDAVSLDRIGRKILGDAHRHVFKVKLYRGLLRGVAQNDRTPILDHNRQAETESVDTFDDRIYRGVVNTVCVFVSLDLGK